LINRKQTLLAGGAAAIVTAAAVTMSPISSVSPFKPECPDSQAMGGVVLVGCWSAGTTIPPTTTTTGTTTPTTTTSGTPLTCDLSADTSTFASQVSAATPGQTICLANGNYGTWTGTNKPITLTSANGQGATIALSVGAGDSGFTIDNVTMGRSTFANGATNITVKNSTFIGKAFLTVANSNILFDHNTHDNMDGGTQCAGCEPARVQVIAVNGDHNLPSGVTVENSEFSGGGADGLWTDTGATFIGNEIHDQCNDPNGNHTDAIQVGIGAATGVVIQRNFIHQSAANAAVCDTQSLSAFDELSHAVITDNVVNMNRRPWGIEIYSDDTSLIEHNTVVGDPAPCNFSQPCGQIDINAKTTNDVGFGTIVLNNIATRINTNRATLGERHDNMLLQSLVVGDFIGIPQYVGGADPTTYDGYCLAPGSPGKGAASDGLDVGIRC
jgi:hypothetical protein